MDPQASSSLWMAGFALLVGGTLLTIWRMSRVPQALSDLRTKVREIEAAIALMDGTVKKAARRAGIAERKAKKDAEGEGPGSPLFDLENLPEATDGPPPRGAPRPPAGEGDDLDSIRRHFRFRTNRGG